MKYEYKTKDLPMMYWVDMFEKFRTKTKLKLSVNFFQLPYTITFEILYRVMFKVLHLLFLKNTQPVTENI